MDERLDYPEIPEVKYRLGTKMRKPGGKPELGKPGARHISN